MNQESDSPKPDIEDVKLNHNFNYVGGMRSKYSFKDSKKKTSQNLDPNKLTELVLMTRPGTASRVMIAMPEEDSRAGIYPQHNTIFKEVEANDADLEDDEIIELPEKDLEDFRTSLELIPSRKLEPYKNLIDIKKLKDQGFQKRVCTMTKQRLDVIKNQFSHLSEFAFNQMLDIPRPDKRDFPVYYKILTKSNQIVIAYLGEKSKKTHFVQIIQYNKKNHIKSIKHCTFDEGEPLVINETQIDKFGNFRQIAHVGNKGGSEYYNSVERYDDGTVSWAITHNKETGAAVLRPSGEIVFLEDIHNHAAETAARNLGAEGVLDGEWTGEFDLAACGLECDPMQETFKSKVRDQISNIVDGASIPGLDPIFWI